MSERVVRNVENDYLMCSICLGRYRDPRLLPCGHSFCKQCLEDHIRQTVMDRGSLYFTCPNDRTQVGRPTPGLAPKDWASAYPADTFLTSLLNAVMIHASGSTSPQDTMACESHKGRMKEFFCMRCAETACPYCVVKSHKSDKCDCVGLDEAVEKLRPKTEMLRERLQQQLQRARQAHRGESAENSVLRTSKSRAMTDLTDLETKLTFFYQTAMKQIQEMKETIKETGKSPLNETQQATVILDNINRTIDKFDDVCNHGSGLQVISTLKKVEEQVKEYDTALKALHRHTPSLEIHFTVNHTLERVFENAPVLGSVTVRSSDPGRSTTPRGNTLSTPRGNMLAPRRRSMMATPRDNMQAMPRDIHLAMSWDSPSFSGTPRSQPGTSRSMSRLSDTTPLRPKLSFCVNDEEQPGNCWQLTGVVIVGDHMIVTDAHNGQIIKIETQHPTTNYDRLALECPVCISDIEDSTDVVVTLPELSELAIVSTDSDLTLKETIDTSKPYEGIGRLLGPKFVVSCCVIGKQCIDIIDMAGQVLKTIDNDTTGQPLFSWPRFLSVASGNILVSDRDKSCLLCFDLEGTKKWTYATPASPWGVSCHEGGTIFMCLDNNTVQIVSESGTQIQNNFITARDGLQVPYAIHAMGDYVAVTEWGSSLFQPNSPWVHLFSI